MAQLDQRNIGALPVCDPSGTLIGIISERDIVRALSGGTASLDDLKVADLMTADVVTCKPGDNVNGVMAMMDESHVRHIPVISDGRLSAVISSRDVMAAVLKETKDHVKTLGLAYEMMR